MLKPQFIDPIVKIALQEDIGSRDLTTSSIISPNTMIKADIQFEEPGILCGMIVAERVFRLVDEDIRFLPVAKDGEWIEKKREIAYIEGKAASILTAERTALNFLARLSGIATQTSGYVEKIKSTKARIFDTRKTTPGLRILEKYAVAVGGGSNHRFGLYDQVLIKDNHLRILRNYSIAHIVAATRKNVLKKTVIGIEVKNLKELAEALKERPNYILLDNMSVQMVKDAVAMRNDAGVDVELEVSGGINFNTVLEYAQTGVERISVGALTHSAWSANISLDIIS